MTTLLRPLYLLQSATLPFSRLASHFPIRSVTDPTLFCRPFSYDHVVIGAGVVGLAVAAKLAEYNPPIISILMLRRPKSTNLVIERHDSIGQETSSRNSEGTPLSKRPEY